jgi:hypothetical protein
MQRKNREWVLQNKELIDSMRAAKMSWDDIGKELGIGWRMLMWHYAPDRAEYHIKRNLERSRRQAKVHAQPGEKPIERAKRGRGGEYVSVDVLGELPPPDTRNFTQRFFGDPLPGRSYLDRMRQGQAR